MPYIQLDPSIASPPTPVNFGLPEAASAHPAGKSLSAMRARLTLELGNRTDIPIAFWNEWINDAYLDIVASLDLPESKRSYQFITSNGQPLYLLPSQIDTIRSVTLIDPEDDTNGLMFQKIDTDSYRKLPPSCGPSEMWLREQNILILWPTPDDEYTVTVDARMKPMPLTEDLHYPAVDDKWHELILKSAKARAWEAVQNDTKAALVENAVVRQVQRKRDRDAQDNENAYPMLRPVRSFEEIMTLVPRRCRVEPGD